MRGRQAQGSGVRSVDRIVDGGKLETDEQSWPSRAATEQSSTGLGPAVWNSGSVGVDVVQGIERCSASLVLRRLSGGECVEVTHMALHAETSGASVTSRSRGGGPLLLTAGAPPT